MKILHITQGLNVLLDDEDFEWASQYKWAAENHKHTFYASRTAILDGKYIRIRMHREILGFVHGDGKLVDHKNRNGLDNRRENLRAATRRFNGHNGKMKSLNTSGFRGVSWCKQTEKWLSRIRLGGKRYNLGRYIDEIEAATVYDTAASHYYRKDAVLNFPGRAL